ncbi:MAG: flagellar basal body rod protein FlgC [Edaphobacter sp.]|uniref:flagellar basal body rod protein FlgC n=1 Tax=Edaphobacter sp. TaxID=1934404 RepID=UPI0023A394DE|nr:flagellar basal body rod protein FlgC [Edaphobacter sp.]MDE1178368.1 flagellar basal body rod protein FlgC [Edaphobacter sp.]
MNLFGVMDVSASALKAERVRAEVVAANMANAETTRTADGGPYQRQHVVFSAATEENSFAQSLVDEMSGSAMKPMRRLGSSITADTTVNGGVAVTGVIADQSAPLRRYDPQHPDAGADGYVSYPDINPLTEMVDLMGAQRSYGANASAVQAEKGMLVSSLDILK